MDHQPGHDGALRELALFAGAGGGILGGQLLGWRTVCAVELDAYAAAVLCARQNEGFLPPFPIWGDVRTFDGRPWRGRVDVVSGGFPCQDISVAGRGAGIDGERSGLWSEFARVIGEVRPRYAFVENSPALVTRGLGRVLGDLSVLGYDSAWGVVPATRSGAIHRRERIWIVAADTASVNVEEPAMVEAPHPYGKPGRAPEHIPTEIQPSRWPADQPAMDRVDDGLADWMDRARCLGNGQVPQCAALAWRTLYGLMEATWNEY